METHQSDPEGARGRVLVVDDDIVIRQYFCDLLRSRGHCVEEASNGDEAIRKVAVFMPDAVLMDVVMPGRDGIAVCDALKHDPATEPIPVLLVTGVKDRETRIRGMQAGASDFISKPVDIEEVALRVRNAVHMKQMYDEIQQRCRQLQAMVDLSDNISQMLDSDTETMGRILAGVHVGSHGAEPTPNAAAPQSANGGPSDATHQ